MTDIIKKLRRTDKHGYPSCYACDEAADEIERLRADREKRMKLPPLPLDTCWEHVVGGRSVAKYTAEQMLAYAKTAMNESKQNLSYELYLTLRRIQQQVDLLAQQVDTFVVKYCPDELTDKQLDQWIDAHLSDKQEK